MCWPQKIFFGYKKDAQLGADLMHGLICSVGVGWSIIGSDDLEIV